MMRVPLRSVTCRHKATYNKGAAVSRLGLRADRVWLVEYEVAAGLRRQVMDGEQPARVHDPVIGRNSFA
jgi:hypothetical protein